MDTVAGFLEIGQKDDTHRHLADLLRESATYAEAETVGSLPKGRRYRRENHSGK